MCFMNPLCCCISSCRSKQEYFSVFHGLEQIWQSFIGWISLGQLCRENNLRDWLVISFVGWIIC
jgi:hypothetical protein